MKYLLLLLMLTNFIFAELKYPPQEAKFSLEVLETSVFNDFYENKYDTETWISYHNCIWWLRGYVLEQEALEHGKGSKAWRDYQHFLKTDKGWD